MKTTLALFLILVSIAADAAGPRRRATVRPSGCVLLVPTRSVELPPGGGSAGVPLQPNGDCTFTPTTAAPWLQISSSPTPGFVVQAGPNTTGAPRMAIVDVGGYAVTVTQNSLVTNLVVNGAFDSNTSGWLANFSTGTGSATWARDSVVVSPGGGGVAVLTSTQARAGYQLHQCVNVKPSTSYDAGAHVFIPNGQDAAGTTIFGIYEVPLPNCETTAFIQSRQLTHKAPTGVWTPLSTTYTTTSRAQSLIIAIAVGGVDRPPFTAWFDDVYVREKN